MGFKKIVHNKQYNRLKSFFLSLRKKKVSASELKNCKLVMTLLVKNEQELLEDNIKFHLNHGVDFIIATDNASTDSTPEILAKYEKKGLLHIINEPSDAYEQALWVNRMGKIAYEQYKATIIFHCDADEFWEANCGNLKIELLSQPNIDVLRVSAQNKIMVDENGHEQFPQDVHYTVVKTSKKKSVSQLSNNRYLKKAFKKVMFKTNKGLFDVTMGNHKIVDDSCVAVQKKSRNIIIHHYPARGKEHFYNKVIGGGQAIANTENISKNAAKHWRKWYDQYQNGELEQEYKTMVLTKEVAEKLKKKKIIKDNTFNPFSR